MVLLLAGVEWARCRTALLTKLNCVALQLALTACLAVESAESIVGAGSGRGVQTNRLLHDVLGGTGILHGLLHALTRLLLDGEILRGDVLLVLGLGCLSLAENTATSIKLLVGKVLLVVCGLRIIITPCVLELVHSPDDVLGLGLRVGRSAVEDLAGRVLRGNRAKALVRLAGVQEIREPVDDMVRTSTLTGMRAADDEELGVLSHAGTKGFHALVCLVGSVNEVNLLERLGKTLKSRGDLGGSEDGLEVAIRGRQALGDDGSLLETVTGADGEVGLRTGLARGQGRVALRGGQRVGGDETRRSGERVTSHISCDPVAN
ncbi:hypothetical protein HG530_011063 [Fusarium avenaceum]|nr:hypothetical protein HG530_011063 [Fusarium avenaceum]